MKKIMVADAVIDLAGTHDELMRTFGYSSDRAWEIAEKLCSDRYGVNFESLHAFMGRKVDGSANLDDISDRIPDFDITSEEYDSIGGVIIGLLDRLPDDGDEVITPDGIRLKVISVDHNHIDKVHIFMPKEDPEAHKEDKE